MGTRCRTMWRPNGRCSDSDNRRHRLSRHLARGCALASGVSHALYRDTEEDYSYMPERQDHPPTVDFTVDPISPSKRPEQLVSLLESALRLDFPEALETVEIWHAPGEPVVSIRNLEQLDEQVAKNLARRARGVFNEFMTSPWY